MKKQKTIGVLGGMGPAASASCLTRMLQYASDEHGAVLDEEYPPIVLRSIALEGFDETGAMEMEKTKAELIAGAQTLEAAGADIVVIPCNTVHFFHKEINESVGIPVFNLIQETTAHVASKHYKTVGLLCSESTNNTQLYQQCLQKQSISTISPSPHQQQSINKVIWNVLANSNNKVDVEVLRYIAHQQISMGAEALILGCTELPLVLQQSHIDIPVIDTLQILSEAAVEFARSSL